MVLSDLIARLQALLPPELVFVQVVVDPTCTGLLAETVLLFPIAPELPMPQAYNGAYGGGGGGAVTSTPVSVKLVISMFGTF
jgi:hypothetical protein